MTSLRDLRIEFSYCIALLVVWAHDQGLKVCFDKEGLSHMKGSNHYVGLAKDLIRYDDKGEYLTHSSDYEALGEKWESMHESARWGGRFVGKSAGDGGHFSFEHNGVR